MIYKTITVVTAKEAEYTFIIPLNDGDDVDEIYCDDTEMDMEIELIPNGELH